jgi:glycosyl transferase family 25
MRVILINLARATDRRDIMRAQFDAQHLPFEVLEATDGRTITDIERNLVDHDQRKRITPYPLTDNEIGCWLSHRRAIASVAEGTEPMAVILEDDTAITPEFATTLAQIEQVGTPFDFIFLHRGFKRNEVFASCRPLGNSNSMGRVGPMSMGCHAYVVSREGAQKFMARPKRFAHAVDKEIHRYWASGLDIYGLLIPVAKHADKGKSYIDETRNHDKPQTRARYGDADHLYWRWQRYLTRVRDSIAKRVAFPSYVRSGRLRVRGGTA